MALLNFDAFSDSLKKQKEKKRKPKSVFSSSQFIYRINLDKTPESVTIQSEHLRQISHHAPPHSVKQKGLNIAPNQHQLKLEKKEKKGHLRRNKN